MTHRAVELAEYRRTVAEEYAAIRSATSLVAAHRAWIANRDMLFRDHPQSALSVDERRSFEGLPYWAYDAQYRVAADLEDAASLTLEIPHSRSGTTRFTRIGQLHFELRAASHRLDLFWLDAYGGGLFLPFRDETNGAATYGGGRYLLDTVKGADLGSERGGLILDFNFAYHPSCVYSTQWSCPLAPPSNVIDVAVEAGERLRPT